MVEDPPSLPAGQPRLGVPEVWTLKRWRKEIYMEYMGTGQCTRLAAATRKRAMAMAVVSPDQDRGRDTGFFFLLWRSGTHLSSK